MPYAYSNNGQSFRAVESDWPLADGEILFLEHPTESELLAAFPTRADSKRVEGWQKIKDERDRRTENGGYKVTVGGIDKWFHSDQKSRSQQLGLVLLGANIPNNLQWKTMDGSFVAMTQELALQVLSAGAASDQTIFTAAETHKQAMESSADPSAYDFSAGWPVTFPG
ncbi:MAG TPA: DUF4376 domain-containing protein [Rhodocyclaceae bacterium]|nr:DUF4376 domain-containing protein [Rhodocyclaceae bacterium]